MALESGRYYIFSKLGDAPVGRRHVEDFSLFPKGVYKLSNGAEAPVWVVEKLPNGNYTLKAGGAVVGAFNAHVLAFLIEAQALPGTTEWALKCDERDAEGNSYVVTKAGHQDGWVVDDSDGLEHIIVQPVVAGLILPPFYPPTAVFVFKKIG